MIEQLSQQQSKLKDNVELKELNELSPEAIADFEKVIDNSYNYLELIANFKEKHGDKAMEVLLKLIKFVNGIGTIVLGLEETYAPQLMQKMFNNQEDVAGETKKEGVCTFFSTNQATLKITKRLFYSRRFCNQRSKSYG